MGRVNITLANGQLGATMHTNDGIAGMVLTGTTDPGGYEVNTPVLITGLSDLDGIGITEGENPFAYRQVKEFYNEAGSGAQLYLMLVPPTMNVSSMADVSKDEGAKRLLDYAAGKIKILGLMTNDNLVYTSGYPIHIVGGMNGDVYGAVANMAIMARQYFEAEKPFRAIIGGTSYSGPADTLTDITAGTTNNRTAILIGDTQAGSAACLGMFMGRIAAQPVQRKVSRVRTGALTNSKAYLGMAALEDNTGAADVIAENGFITFKTYPNVSGYFFSGDGTASALTDDYHFLARGRVIDKAHILAYTTFVQEVDEEVPVNADGKLDAGFCKWLSRQIVNQINNTMTANKEISGVSCFIDPAQNILSTNSLNIVLKITPVGYATDIEINLGFENPSLQ